MKILITLTALAILSLFISSCADDPSSIGIDLVGSENLLVNSFNTQDDSTAQTSSSYKEVVSLGLSSRVFIGIKGNIEASTLMKFDFITADSMDDAFLNDSITITKAYIRLYPDYTYNDDQQSMDFNIYKINNYWTSSSYTIDSLPLLDYDNSVDLSFNKSFTDSIYTLDIDNNSVLDWIKSSIDTNYKKNYGIYFKPTMGSGKIVGFPGYSLSDTSFASLTVIIEKTGSYIDTISGYLTSDVSVVSGELPTLPAGEIAVQGGITVKSKLFFDIKNIPDNVVINNAQLILKQDTLNSVLSSSGAGTIRIYGVVDSTTDSLDYYTTVLMTKNDDIYTGSITPIVDRWVNDKDNQGIILTTGTQNDNLEMIAIKGSDYSVFLERPEIKVVYSKKE